MCNGSEQQIKDFRIKLKGTSKCSHSKVGYCVSLMS